MGSKRSNGGSDGLPTELAIKTEYADWRLENMDGTSRSPSGRMISRWHLVDHTASCGQISRMYAG